MFEFTTWMWALAAVCALMSVIWAFSVPMRDVSIIDGFWSLAFLLALGVYLYFSPGDASPRRELVSGLVAAWSLRLAIYLFWRNWGEPEDRRYVQMRDRQGPSFWWVSFFTIFMLQAPLAWVISLPLLPAVNSALPLGAWDWAACALWTVGMLFQVGGDWQLARFKADPANKGRVLDHGFWRYTRHPNYFGEFCIWWGFTFFAFGAAVFWVAIGAILISFLLLKVSGVAMLEADIAQRRPAYADYIRRTSAFLPWFPSRPQRSEAQEGC